MVIREIRAKQILTKSGIPSVDYVINPYVGCQHACVWCYARFMKRFTDHTEPWGRFVDVKINAPGILEKELKKNRPKNIFLSSVTDCYQPLESKYKLTRRILEILSKYQIPVTILTESVLVLRDIDILKKMKDLEVSFTIVSDSDEINRLFQPFSSLPSQRIKALAKLKKAGIKTCIHLGPILPRITNMESIFKKISGKVDCIMAETLNTKGTNWFGVAKVLRKHFPELLKEYQRIFFTPLEIRRPPSAPLRINKWLPLSHQRREGGFLTGFREQIFEQDEALFNSLCQKYKIKNRGFFTH